MAELPSSTRAPLREERSLIVSHIIMAVTQNKALFDILSNIVDTTFNSSERQPNVFIKFRVMDDNTIAVMAQRIVNVQSANFYNEMRKHFEEDLVAAINKSLENMKTAYGREVEIRSKRLDKSSIGAPATQKAPAKISLKMVPGTLHDDLEFVGMSAYRSNKQAFYKVFVDVAVTAD